MRLGVFSKVSSVFMLHLPLYKVYDLRLVGAVGHIFYPPDFFPSRPLYDGRYAADIVRFSEVVVRIFPPDEVVECLLVRRAERAQSGAQVGWEGLTLRARRRGSCSHVVHLISRMSWFRILFE